MRKILIRVLLKIDGLIQGIEDSLRGLRIKVVEIIWFIAETGRRDASKSKIFHEKNINLNSILTIE